MLPRFLLQTTNQRKERRKRGGPPRPPLFLAPPLASGRKDLITDPIYYISFTIPFCRQGGKRKGKSRGHRSHPLSATRKKGKRRRENRVVLPNQHCVTGRRSDEGKGGKKGGGERELLQEHKTTLLCRSPHQPLEPFTVRLSHPRTRRGEGEGEKKKGRRGYPRFPPSPSPLILQFGATAIRRKEGRGRGEKKGKDNHQIRNLQFWRTHLLARGLQKREKREIIPSFAHSWSSGNCATEGGGGKALGHKKRRACALRNREAQAQEGREKGRGKKARPPEWGTCFLIVPHQGRKKKEKKGDSSTCSLRPSRFLIIREKRKGVVP